MLTVCGAGAVGLVLGARLALAGRDVLFVTRRPEAAAAIADEGVRLEDPSSGATQTARADATADLDAAGARIGEGPVLFCVRAPQTREAARAIAARAGGAVAASFANDVDNEAVLAERFARVVGGLVRQTCTRTAPNAARALRPGRVVVGAHPEGRSAEAEALAADLRAAGYEVGVSERIADDLWLKLAINLMSAPNALVRRDDHATAAFVELKARLLEEAAAALDAAGIPARSCDGRDRSLPEEIAWQRGALERGDGARPLPLYNQVWSALRGDGPLEADGYHRRIVELAAASGTEAPVNARVLDALNAAARASRGPECLAASELLGPR